MFQREDDLTIPITVPSRECRLRITLLYKNIIKCNEIISRDFFFFNQRTRDCIVPGRLVVFREIRSIRVY